MGNNPDTLYSRLLFFLDEHREYLDSTNHEQQLQVIERLRFLLHLEEGTLQAIIQEAQLSQVVCCECGSRIPNHPEYQRLKLCTMCMCSGLFARCAFCGENYPEHHPGGRGCSKWERRADPEPLIDEMERL
jgi:hypothetical protein